MKHFEIRRGEKAPADPAPAGPIEDAADIRFVALLGEDWPGLRPHVETGVGSRVVRGQTLFTDRRNREIRYVSPVSGIVESLTYGPRRTLDALILRVGPDESEAVLAPPGAHHRTSPARTLLAAGFWPAFRTRPFGCVPAADATAEAILVNAVRAAPQSPDPGLVLRNDAEDFRLGCEILAQLTDGPVYLCQSPGEPLGPDHPRIRHASFSGTLAAGLAGTQIDRLCPGLPVWSIGYQDVAAIGRYFDTGEYPGRRVVSITGPMASPARLLRVPLGTRIADLIGTAPVRAVPGGPDSPRDAAYLGRFDDRITLLPRGPDAPRERVRPRVPGHSASVPSRALETAIAVDVLPVPLLRALSIGDAEAAERLGCLALVEEDLAAATRRCTSGVDYGACLRRVLEDLREQAA